LQQVVQEAPQLALPHYFLGIARLRQAKPQLAREELNEAIRIAPRFTEAHLALAEVEMVSGAFDYAIAAAELTLNLQPDNAAAHRILGRASLGKGEVGKALVTLKRATEKAPQHALGYYYLGVAYRRNKQSREALTACEQALALDPNLQDALLLVVELYLQ